MVSAKTRNKIWANEYVNFELLLHTQVIDDCYSIKMLHNKEGGHPALTIVPNQKKQTITNIESWTNAFHIFTAIYMEKWPQDGPALMTYGAVVRDLAKNFPTGSSMMRTFEYFVDDKLFHGTIYTHSFG